MQVELAASLIDIESELRQLMLWQEQPPAAELLMSDQPFCIDTLTLPQWLQFVFLPRLYQMIERRQPLPANCAVTPVAQEYFNGLDLPVQALLEALESVDRLLSGPR